MSPSKTECQLYLDVFDHYHDELKGMHARSVRARDGYQVGREEKCDLTLYSDTVSGTHAEFKFDSENNVWSICDLNSSNGIFFNGQKVSRQELRDGHRLYLGESLLIAHLKWVSVEKTKIFTVLEKQEKVLTFKNLGRTLIGLALFLFIYLEFNYFQTDQQIYKHLLKLFGLWFVATTGSGIISWLVLRSARPLRYAILHLQAIAVIGLVFSLYPVISISLVSPSVDEVLSEIILFGVVSGYLFVWLRSFQRIPVMRKPAIISVIVSVLLFVTSSVAGHFYDHTLLETHFAHPFLLPSQSHTTVQFEHRLDELLSK